MNNDLISREELKKTIKEAQREIFVEVGNAFEMVYKLIDNAPAVYPICEDKACKYRADERPRGEWICITKSTFPQYQPDEYKCPFCNVIVHWKTNYCEYCGAKMKGGADNG